MYTTKTYLQTSLIAHLSLHRRWRLVTHGDEEVEKAVDVRLAINIPKLACADAYSTAILVSHDGDVADAVLAVKEMEKRIIHDILCSGARTMLKLCIVAERKL